MPDSDLQHRLEMLESTVESLRKLPAEVRQLHRRMGRVESQVLQLRTEMRGEFSAMRAEMSGMATKAELQAAGAGAVRELTGAIAETRDELRKEIAEVQRHTTVLFEDVIARLKIIGERQ
jgi:hypothetical protein